MLKLSDTGAKGLTGKIIPGDTISTGSTPIDTAARKARVLAAYAPGLTITQTANLAGVSYATTRNHLVAAGIKAKREPYSHEHKLQQRKVDPDAVISAAHVAPNFTAVARSFNISRERVRQIVDRNDRDTNRHTARGGRDLDQYPLKCVEQQCSGGCGAIRQVQLSLLMRRPSWRCPNCGRGRLARIEDVLRVVDQRLAGAMWAEICRLEGYNPKHPQTITREVASRLRRSGRDDIIAKLWPDGPPNWLKKWLGQ